MSSIDGRFANRNDPVVLFHTFLAQPDAPTSTRRKTGTTANRTNFPACLLGPGIPFPSTLWFLQAANSSVVEHEANTLKVIGSNPILHPTTRHHYSGGKSFRTP